MSYHFGREFGQSGIQAVTQQARSADQAITNQDIMGQITAKLNQVKQAIRTVDPAKGSQAYVYLDKVKGGVSSAIDLLDPTADQQRLAKVQAWSSLEDNIALLGVFALFGSMIALAYFRKNQ